MDTLEKALLSFKNVLKNIDKNELSKIVSKIDNMDNQNISYFDYLNDTEEEYSLLYDFECYSNVVDSNSFNNSIFLDNEHESLNYTNNKLDKFNYCLNGLETNYSEYDSITLDTAA
jgi:hypothetical protein